MTTDIHQADVAATENYQASVVEKLRALATRLNDIADHRESNPAHTAFFGTPGPLPTDEQSMTAAREAIRNAGL